MPKKKTTTKSKKTQDEKSESQSSTKDILLIGYWQHLKKYIKEKDIKQEDAIIVSWENTPDGVFDNVHKFKFPQMQGWKDSGLIKQGLLNGDKAMKKESIRKVKELHIVHNRTYVIKEDLTTKGVREIDVTDLINNN